MRSQKNILIKKTVIPICIENESLIYKGKNSIVKEDPFCIEGSSMRASGSAPNLQLFARKSQSPEDYIAQKKISNEKRSEIASLLLFKGANTIKQSNVKLQPLSTVNTKSCAQLPALQFPSSLSKDIKLDQGLKQLNIQQSSKKLKPLNSIDHIKNLPKEKELNAEAEEIVIKKPKKVKSKKKEQNKESQVQMKRIYKTQEAIQELIKIVQELEIIVEGDINSEDLKRIISNLIKGKEEVKREMILCRKEESFDLIYEKMYSKVIEAICHQEFSDNYQYISKKFTEVLNQTPYVPQDQNCDNQ